MLVLASASPRRRELLRWLVAEYELDTAEIDESARPGEPARPWWRGSRGRRRRPVAARRRGAWILAADTIVEIDGEVLGKPADEREAVAMLGRLSGREHRVFTGFTLLSPGGEHRSGWSSRACASAASTAAASRPTSRPASRSTRPARTRSRAAGRP
jgi:septum formation protein